MEQKKPSFGARIKESIRKGIVTLKHKPHYIPMAMLVVTFLYYALHLTTISNTTAKIQGPHMGLCGFIIMLLSILSLVCFGNAFPHRKPVNKPMLILMFAMLGIIIFADVTYINAVISAVFRPENPIQVTQSTAYIAYSQVYLQNHIVMMVISIVLTVTMPLYSKLIRKIPTSIEVDAGEEMAAIDISGED